MKSKANYQELAASEKRFRDLVETTSDWIWEVDSNGIFTFVSPQVEQLIGYAPEELVGKRGIDFMEPEEAERITEMLEVCMENRAPIANYESETIHKDGSPVIFDTNGVPILDEQGILLGYRGICRDITGRKQVEKDLKESEEKYRSLFENNTFLTYLTDSAGNILMANTRGAEFMGLSQEDIVGKSFFELRPDRAQMYQGIIDQVMSSGESLQFETLFPTQKEDKWLSVSVSPIAIGKETRLQIISQDITLSKQAEEALRQSEKKFRNILDNLKDVYFETALDGTILFASPSGAELSGYSMDELIGNNAEMLYFNPEDRVELVNRLRENGKVRDYEIVFKKKNGELYDVSFNADIYFDEGGQPTGITGTIRDVTEQKKLNAQLQRSKKMESLGLMAGGIAHDLNNILSGIVSYPELLLMQIPDDSPMRKSLEVIKESGQRAADVVSDLLTITKGTAIAKQVQNLNSIVKEYLISAEQTRLEYEHPHVVFESSLDVELLSMNCSPPHMMKILMNLVWNATEAIKHQGKVTITTANRYLDQPLKGYVDVLIGEYVLLIVSDTGSGISQDDIEMIFEPFYSKKAMGRSGTGLGLAVVWNTVHDHDGYINVTSGENGTVFELYFPVAREETAIEKEHISFEDYLGGGERILVVDDDLYQREIACQMLTTLGYSAEAVSSGAKAIHYLEKHSVDLLVLDMLMPHMTGREAYERIIQIHPNQKAVIASGFAETGDVKAAQKLGAGKYIKKPYTLEKIGLAVRDELKR